MSLTLSIKERERMMLGRKCQTVQPTPAMREGKGDLHLSILGVPEGRALPVSSLFSDSSSGRPGYLILISVEVQHL